MKRKLLLVVIIAVAIIYAVLLLATPKYTNLYGLFSDNSYHLTCRCVGEVIKWTNPAADPSSGESCKGVQLPFSCYRSSSTKR